MPRWRNWHTRMLEVHVPQGLRVRVPPWAPISNFRIFLRTASPMAEHRVYIAEVIGSSPMPSTSRDSSVVEHFSEKEGVESPILSPGTKNISLPEAKAGLPAEAHPKASISGCRIAAIILPCQGRDGGSTPLTRSKDKQLNGIRR